jgi:glycosyltransferase involved in cell wall biosynthesis
MHELEQFAELRALQEAGLQTLLHLHWLHLVLDEASDEADADRRLERFLDGLDAHRAAGGWLAWTVHNVLPHEARFELAEARLSSEVARRSDVVHVLAAGTPAHVAPYYELPADRLLHVPHPSYAGAYPQHVSRLDARHELGLLPDELVFAVVGAIRPYKGLTALLDAWQALDPAEPRRLLIAGAPGDEPGVRELVERALLDPTILIDARKIPADEIQLYLRAADVAVLPYVRSLNSGALALALTFGLPVIVPAGGALAEVVDAGFARTFEPGDPDSLRAALAGGRAVATPAAGRAAAAAAAALDPGVLSRRFARGLRERLEARAPVALARAGT